MTNVIISPLARRDLTEIGDYIAKDNRRAARDFVREIRHRCDLLRTRPLTGRPREEFGQDVRAFTHRSYLIIYRYRPEIDHVNILRFWHGRRLPPDISQLE